VSGVWKDIWTSLKAVVGLPATVVALILAVLGNLWNPSFTVSFSLISLAVMAFVVVIIIATAVKMAIDARRRAGGDLPRAVHVYNHSAAEGSTNDPITLVMSGSRQFGVNILVTVHYEEGLGREPGEIFERVIGIGQVVHVQESGLIQVRVLREVVNHSELWQRIQNREMASLSRVGIKPSIDFNAVGIEVQVDERG
jgi:hypothetical protein